jgi:hypothetical protein
MYRGGVSFSAINLRMNIHENPLIGSIFIRITGLDINIS